MKTESYPRKHYLSKLFMTLILTFLILVGVNPLASGQTIVTLGTGTSTTTTGPFYSQADHQWQGLYTAAEILAAGGCGGTINQIGFNFSTAQTTRVLSNFTIKMMHTTASVMPSAVFSTTGFTDVYAGDYTVPGTGWQMITLSTPFVWDGSSNIYIMTCFDNTASGTASSVRYTTQSVNMHKYYYGLNTFTLCNAASIYGPYTSRPNLQLNIAISGPLYPSSFSAVPSSATSVTLNATPVGGNNVVILYNTVNSFTAPSGPPPSTPGDPFAGGFFLYNGTTFPQVHSGLALNTMYYYQAWSWTGSEWSCAPLNASANTTCYASLPPYSENFEGITVNNELPTCWGATDLGTNCRTYIAATGSYNQYSRPGGTKFASFYYSPGGANDWFFTKPLHLEAGTVYMASAWYITDGYSGWNNFSIYYGGGANSASMTNLVANVSSPMNTTYNELAGYFTPAVTGDYYFGIYCNGNTAPYYLTFDDFSVIIPSAIPPLNFTATAMSASQIDLGWTLNPLSNDVMLVTNTVNVFGDPVDGTVYADGSSIPGGGTVIYNGNATSFNHMGLVDGQTYFYKIFSRTNAPDYGYSPGIAANATTFCGISTVPYSMNFEGVTAANQLPACWASTSLASYTYTGVSPQTYNRASRPGGTSYGYYCYGANDWFFSKAVQLNAGESYNAGLWYVTDGYSGWNTLSMYYGTAQNSGAMVNFISSVNNPINTTYQQMTGVFTAPASGTYYFGIYCSATGSPWYLTIDDFTLELLTLPNCAINPYPANAATNAVRNPTITWENGGQASDYDFYFGTTNPPPFVMNTSGSSYVPGLLDANATYYWQVVPHNVLGYSTGCPVWSFNTGTGFNYCASYATSPTSYEFIAQVDFNTISNNTNGVCTGYTDFSAISTDLIGTYTYPITVYGGSCSTYGYSTSVKVFIDYNQDGDFDDPNETVMTSGPLSVSMTPLVPFTANITIPASALGGQTKMRIVLVETSSPSGITPCGTYTWGETEDYTLNIIPYNWDLAVTGWVNPGNSCDMTATEAVTIQYRNYGLATQSNYVLSYFDGTSWVNETVTVPIAPGETKTYTFTTTADFSTLGEYLCKAAVSLANDLNTANDTLQEAKVRNYPTILITDPEVTPLPGPYLNDFDGGNSYWYSRGDNDAWELGTPAKTFINDAKSTPNAWVTKLTGDYPANSFSIVESPCFDLSQVLNPLFRMDVKYQIEAGWDGALLMYTTNNQDWFLVGDLYHNTNWYNDTAFNGLPVWGGQTPGTDYITVEHQLTGLGGQSSVKLAVLFMSDAYVEFEGFAFDNVKIYESPILFASCADVNIEGTVGGLLDLKIKGGLPPYFVEWSPAIGLSLNPALCPTGLPINCLKPIAAPPVTTTYTAKVWDNKQPADTVYTSATVFVYPELEVDARWDATVCDTAYTQLYAITNGGVPPYIYEWDNVATLSSGTIFNPVATPHVTTTYSVTVTDALGFSNVDQVTLTIVSGYPTPDIHPNGANVCEGDAIQLTATGGLTYVWTVYPSGGATISNANIANPWVTPLVNGVKLTCTIFSPCGNSSDFVILNVLPRPVVALAAFSPAGYCYDHAAVVLTGGTPAGGTYSGNGVIDGVFYPNVAGVGTHTITYTYINPAVNNCPGTASRPLSVYPLPAMNFIIGDDVACIDEAPFAITGIIQPSGGTFSGNGIISGGYFDPALAGLGEHIITYTVVSPFGCIDSRTDTMFVYPLPLVELAPFADVCVNAAAFNLTGGTPVGGYYSGPGITTSPLFDPALAGVGTHTIYYYYTDGNGCTNYATNTITVLPLPYIVTGPSNDTICYGETRTISLDLVGTGPWTISWTVDGVAASPMVATTTPFTFDLSPLVTTTYALTEIVCAVGCPNDFTDIEWEIVVNENPLPYYVVMNDPNGYYCANTGGIAIGLSGSEIGVTYELYRDGVSTGITFAGPGTAFWFYPNMTLDGQYDVLAISDLAPTYCETWMDNPVTIVTEYLDVNLFAEFTEICLGGTTILEAYMVNPNISTGPYTFDWAGPNMSPNGFASVLANPVASTWYYVTVSDPTGCTAIDSVYITVNDLPVVAITGSVPNPICAGSSVTLQTNVTHGSGSSVVSYTWTPLTALDVTDPSAPVASPMSNTTYHVMIKDDNGCEGSVSYDVTVIPSPNVVFAGPSTANICPGASTTIPLMTPTVGSGSYTYLWTPADGLDDPTLQTPVANPVATTTYTVTITDLLSNCSGTGSYTVVVNAPIVVELGPSFNICNGTPANLYANIISGGVAPFNFAWTSVPSFTISPTQNPSVIPAPNTTTVFTVVVSDYYGCTGTDNIAVSSDIYPVAHAGANDTICQGECTTLIGSGGISYQWFMNGNPITGVTANPELVVCPSATTEYELRVVSPCGAAISFVSVIVNPETPLDIWIPQTTFCQNDASVILVGTPMDANGTFTGNGITDNGDGTATFNPIVVGTYDLTYTYVNEFGCDYVTTVSVTVLPLPGVTLDPIGPLCLNATPVTLTGGLPLGGVYSGPGVSGGVFNPAVAGIGTHTIIYSFTDVSGCMNTASIEVVVNDLPLVFDVSVENGGHYCAYPSPYGVHIFLSSSQPYASGVTYKLVLNGLFTGISYPGTGAMIDFGAQTATGVYTIVAEYNATGCSQLMNGSVTVVIDPLPLVYNVTGGGNYCSGGTGVGVGLDNSNYGITYYLYRNGSNTGVSHPGISGPFMFADQTAAGTYTVVAVDDVTGCERTMAGSTTITILPLPFPYFVYIGNSGQQSITACPGTSITIRQNANECGVIYELYHNGVPTGLTRTCLNGASFTWVSNSWAAGVYTVVATRQNEPYFCQRTMNGSATINYYVPASVAQQPVDAFIDEGESTSFSVLGAGDNISVQWYVSADNGASWVPVVDGGVYSGAISNTLYINYAPYSMTGYLYRARITGPCNNVYSNAAKLYIDPIVNVIIENVTSCVSNNIQVPVVFTNADSINAVSLTIYYDNTNFNYVGYTNLNPILLPAQLSVFSTNNWIRISYFDVINTINTGHGAFPFLNLIFDGSNASGTTHDLTFDLVTQGACELSKISGELLTANFYNGSVTVVELPIIVEAYASPNALCQHENIYLHAMATHPEGVSYEWTGPAGFTSTDPNPVIYDAGPVNAGIYTVTVRSLVNGCVATANVEVFVYPEPALYTVILPNGNNACAGSGVEVAMDNSELGVTYELYLEPNNITPVAIAVGTGMPITFGPQPVTGNYVVKATTIHGCVRWMNGSVNIQINPLPLWFFLQGGGHYCEGGIGRELKLNGSQIGVEYTLLLNACCCQWDEIVMTLHGTGSPISFGYITTPGYYSVVAMNPSTGCGNNMIGCIPIIIDPLPTAVISGAPAVCYGECADVTLTMTGQTPFTVVLNDGTSDFTVVAPYSPFNVNVCPTATTTYTIVSITDGNMCTNTGSGSATVTIWDLPVIVVGNNTPVCVGGAINLTADATGFGPFTFSWTGPDGFTSTEQNPIIPVSTLANNGTYMVMVTDGHGCVNSAETQVVVNPLPTTVLSANAPCDGGELFISGSNTYVTYAWTGPNGFTSTDNPVIIDPATLVNAGIYEATITDVNGCVNVFQIEVIVHPLPVVSCGNNSPVCVGQAINLTADATGNGPFTYYWTGPDGFSSSDQNPQILNAQLLNAGDYTVMVYDGFQCVNSCVTTVIVNPLPEICPVYVSQPNVYCFGCIPPEISLGCSQLGVDYELYLGGVATGISLAGTGSALNFGEIQTPGFYTIYAVNATTGCAAWMYGEVEIIEQAPPTAVISGDVICVGETAEMEIVLTGDTYWDVVITDGLTKDTIHITSSPYTYIPGNGPHILAPTATTTYTIILVSDRVCYNVGNSATVTVNPLPNKYTVTGGGYYCTGIGVYVGLNGSQLGINYVLHQNGYILDTIPGTGGPITFGPQVDGMYWVTAYNPVTGCMNSMNGQAIVLPDPGLTGYEVSGGGSYCQGSEGVCIYLSGSQTGKEYKLLLNGIYTGTTLIGTGYQLVFCNILVPGTYTILAFDPISTCTRTMNSYASVIVRPLPTATIGVDATICYGDVANLHVDLTGTAPWTFVVSDGINSVVHHSAVAAWDSLVNPTSTRTYVVTSVVDMYCQNNGSGSALITVNSPVPYVMTGGGSFCAGDQGVVVGLSGSQVGVSYALQVNGVATGLVLAGTGSPLSFGLQTLPGNYTVIATTLADGCSRTMNGVAIVVITPLPEAFNVTGGGDCCVGCTHVFVCLDGSQIGIRYELYINGLPAGIYRNGTGQPFCYDYATVAGIYTIKAVNISTGCWRWMDGSAEVILWPTAQGGISGDAAICAGSSTDLTVSFSAGTAPFSFGLTSNGSTVTYNGIMDNPYTFSVSPVITSVYTLAWVSDVYGCYNNLTTGSATVTVTPLPGVELANFNPVCIDVAPFALTGGYPVGGVYSGVGVDNGMFYPALAGAGSHVILYTYTDISGCQGYASNTIVVNPLPEVSFTGLDGGYCVDAQAVLLIGNQAPYGYFVGVGVTDNGDGTAYFTPSVAGIGGPYTVTYVYTDPNGCTNSASGTTTVIALPDVWFTGLASTYCVNHAAVELTGNIAGGVFSGTGIINGNYFDPATAGVGGPYTITYSYTNGNYCTNSFSLQVTVLPLPTVCDFVGGGICCIGCSVTAMLYCSEQGVSYQLVRNGTLFMGAPKLGTGLPLSWEIFLGGSYTVVATDLATGCTVEMTGVVVVEIIPQPTAVVSGTTSICEGQSTTITVDLTGTPPFEIWFVGNMDTVIVHSINAMLWDTVVTPSVTTVYKVVSMTDLYCGSFGTGSATVTVNPAPAVFNVTGGGEICFGSTGVNIGVDGSENGIHYELFLDGVTTGEVVVGDGNAIDFGLFNAAGTYTVISMSAVTCEYQMNGDAIVSVLPLPTVELVPFANVCVTAPAFTLSGGSPVGGTYYVDGIAVSYFDAMQVGVGNHVISYTFVDSYGCSNTAYQNLMVYALPSVTLAPFASVCFDAPEFMLSGGDPVGGDYYVNGVVSTMFDPSMYGAGVYTITYMYTDGNGCPGEASQSLTVYALPQVTLAQFAQACLNGDPIVLTGGQPAGGIYSGPYVTNGEFNPIMAGDFVITYTYTSPEGCTGVAQQTITVAPCAVYNINGVVTYDNTAGTIMNGVTVELRQSNVVLATTVTDGLGNYTFGSLTPGSYTVTATSSKPWGGVNSNDALAIMKHFAGITILPGLKAKAANVNGDGIVNSTDALMVARRFVNQLSSFPVGDWAFQVNTVVITTMDAVNDFEALCYGDVNASYTPPFVKTPPTVNLNTAGVKEIKSNVSFELPIHVATTLKVGAISLVINYPENLVDVEGVIVNAPSSNFLYTAINGELRISWYAMKEVVFNSNDVLVTLQLRSKNISGASTDELALTLNGISELGDRNAMTIENVNLTYPKLAVAVETYSISNYPNPFKDVTEIVYNLPESGNVTLKVYNILGDVVAILVNNVEQAANTYQVTFDGSQLVPGIYTYKLEVKGQANDYVKSAMMVISR